MLTFRLEDGIDGRQAMMVDDETRTWWVAIMGEAVGEELAGARLERVPFHYSFWFAWKDFYPETEVYE